MGLAQRKLETRITRRIVVRIEAITVRTMVAVNALAVWVSRPIDGWC